MNKPALLRALFSIGIYDPIRPDVNHPSANLSDLLNLPYVIAGTYNDTVTRRGQIDTKGDC